MDYLIYAFIPISLICTLVATIRLSVEGYFKFPDYGWIRFISSPYWCICLVLYAGWTIGDFARNESSAIPWVEFINKYSEGDIFSAIFYSLKTIITDLWLFWTPAQIYRNSVLSSEPKTLWDYIDKDIMGEYEVELQNHPGSLFNQDVAASNKIRIRFACVTNLLVGLILITPANPIYNIMELFNSPSPPY